MSLFSWFSKKEPVKPTRQARSQSLVSESASSHAVNDLAVTRRAERVERREQLYAVMRDGMTRAGVLSSAYKFKVLSLDSRGGNYLIMVDLSSQASIDSQRMSEIEALIAQNSKIRHEILVAAVYWRLSDHVTAGLTPKAPTQSALHARAPVAPAQAAPHHEAVDVNEMLAFKNAFASGAIDVPLSASGEILKTKRRNPAPQPQFENTEVLDGEERSPLSGTQYGELN